MVNVSMLFTYFCGLFVVKKLFNQKIIYKSFIFNSKF